MRIIAINGSAREDGNTATLLQLVLDELAAEGFDTGMAHLRDTTIAPCRACFACRGKGACAFDDGFNDYLRLALDARGIVLGSPVYSADVSAIMKAFLERASAVAATNPGLFRHKAGAAVAAVRRAGGMHTVDTMHHFFLNKEMFVVGSTYWNMVYGKERGDVLTDDEGIANMKNLGRNMAWLMKRIAV